MTNLTANKIAKNLFVIYRIFFKYKGIFLKINKH